MPTKIILSLCCIILAFNAYDAREKLHAKQQAYTLPQGTMLCPVRAAPNTQASPKPAKPITKNIQATQQTAINLNDIQFAQYLPPLPVKSLNVKFKTAKKGN